MSTSSSATRALPCALPGTPLEAAIPGIETCVHCGFCLQACPTYVTLDDENDSPRGRIVLMRALVDGEIAPTDANARAHLDRCLGCRACETACPSGVPYGHLLEATRATLAEHVPLAPVARVILWIFARPWALALAMMLSRIARAIGLPRLFGRARGRLGFAFAMLDATRSRLHASVPHATYARGSGRRAAASAAATRGSVALLEGCVMEGLFAETNRATERVLGANGFAMVGAPGQRCCGALHAHAGDLESARRLARANIAAFERSGAAHVAVNAAGCGALLKEYGDLLAGDDAWRERARAFSARVRDVSELLADAGPRPGGPLPIRVTYDAPCHLQHAQRVAAAPLAVLRAIPGLELVPLAESEMCCGSAGIYNLVEPETSDTVLRRKLGHIAASGAPWVATGNPGCLMQIGAGLMRDGIAARAVHPVELLDLSYRQPGGA